MEASPHENPSPFDNPCPVLPLAALAAMGELAENSRQGFATKKINSYQGWSEVNFKTVTGIESSLRRTGIRPHCQSWNAYAYALNNPTTRTDPSGLDVWLSGCGQESDTCHKAHWWSKSYLGSWNADHTQFTRTHLYGDLTKTAALGPNGLSVNYNGKTYTGVWDTNPGENGRVYTSAPGRLTFAATGNCPGGSCDLSGFLYKSAGRYDLIDTRAPASAMIRSALSAPGSGFIKEGGIYNIDPWHRGDTNFMGYTPSQPQGLPSTHVPDPSQLIGVIPNVHVDAHYPFEDVEGLAIHLDSIGRSLGLW